MYNGRVPRQPEGKLVAKIKEVMRAANARPFKIHGSDEGFQEIGIPDLLVCFRGWFIGAEVKLPGEKLRPAQRAVLSEIHRAGGIAAVLETTEQAASLLAYLEKRGRHGKTGYSYDRGRITRTNLFASSKHVA